MNQKDLRARMRRLEDLSAGLAKETSPGFAFIAKLL
jgi:hypothetical protein